MKKWILSLAGSFLILSSFAQKSDAVHKAITSPARQTEAGKADVFIQDKQSISQEDGKATVSGKRKKRSGHCRKVSSTKKA